MCVSTDHWCMLSCFSCAYFSMFVFFCSCRIPRTILITTTRSPSSATLLRFRDLTVTSALATPRTRTRPAVPAHRSLSGKKRYCKNTSLCVFVLCVYVYNSDMHRTRVVFVNRFGQSDSQCQARLKCDRILPTLNSAASTSVAICLFRLSTVGLAIGACVYYGESVENDLSQCT